MNELLSFGDFETPLSPESNMPYIHSIIGEVNEKFQFWSNILIGKSYSDNDDTYNDTVPNQTDNNRQNDGESKIVLLRSSEDLDRSQSEVSIGETAIEEYITDIPPRSHRNKEHPVDIIHANTKEGHHEDSIGVLDGTQQDMDVYVWNLERYRFNDDNNNFNYDDIDREILQFKYEGSIGESETIVFHDCDDVLDATQHEEGN